MHGRSAKEPMLDRACHPAEKQASSHVQTGRSGYPLLGGLGFGFGCEPCFYVFGGGEAVFFGRVLGKPDLSPGSFRGHMDHHPGNTLAHPKQQEGS